MYKRFGYCKGRYGSWMSTNCKKSCNKCTNAKPKTSGKYSCVLTTLSFIKYGWKTRFEKNHLSKLLIFLFMFQGCKNRNGRCKLLKRKGYCTGRYVSWMSKNCKKSCNRCSITKSKTSGKFFLILVPFASVFSS